MRSCVSLLLLTAAAASCEPAREPLPEAPLAPLVIGTSPPGAAATSSYTPAAADEPVAAGSPLAIPKRDPRLAHGQPRARPLLVTELQGLESLYATMLPQAPDHPVLARRLADTYAELARAAEGTSVGRNAHRSAARYYEVVSKEAPQSTHRDEAAYYMALEHELEGDRPNARRAYYELIKEFPGSTTIPYAYFAFGEMFLAEAEGDPSKEQLAEQAFREVLKFPPLQNPLYTEAQSRLAEIALRRKGSGLRRP